MSTAVMPNGMKNATNVCFANSVLQAMFSCDTFIVGLKKARNEFSKLLLHFYSELIKTPGHAISADPVYEYIKQHDTCGYITWGLQNDVTDFLHLLIECLKTNAVKTIDSRFTTNTPDAIKENWLKEVGPSYCEITNMFLGHQLSKIECDACTYNNSVPETFRIINLIAPARTSDGTCDLFALFKATFQSETIAGAKCSTCKRSGSKKKRCAMYKSPKILIICVQRFFNATSRSNVRINVDDDDVYVLGDKDYALKAIIMHRGRTPHSGHYTVLCERDDKWYLCDDEIVTVVDDIMKHSDRTGYLYVYEQVPEEI